MTYHFIITVQLGAARISWDNLYEAEPNATRQSVYRAALAATRDMAERQGIPVRDGDFSVLFFSLEPNELPGGAQ